MLFRSLLNQVIREDCAQREEMLPHVALLCRALNSVLCRSRSNPAAGASNWPTGPPVSDEAHTSFRGTGMPATQRSFYIKGRKFRTSMYAMPRAAARALSSFAHFLLACFWPRRVA